jgi:hypothetical protein
LVAYFASSFTAIPSRDLEILGECFCESATLTDLRFEPGSKLQRILGFTRVLGV